MKNIDKNVWIVLGIVVVFLVILFARGQFKGQDDVVLNDSGELAGTEDTSGTTVKTPGESKTPSLTYVQALALYKDKRIQLDPSCQATPDNSTYKNGTSIMIDNRSDKTRTVKAGSTFTLKPWGFKIINLTSTTLPTAWYVDCDSSQNVSTILIQK
jgi:hypothetical protein